MAEKEMILVLDFGGQYNQLIARRVRELSVYSEVRPYTMPIKEIKALNPTGIILTGGPDVVFEDDAPRCSAELFSLGIPVLGICYGAQLMQYLLGGDVRRAEVREYGHTEVDIDNPSSPLLLNVPHRTVCWMSHGVYIAKPAPGFEITAHTGSCPFAAAEDNSRKLYKRTRRVASSDGGKSFVGTDFSYDDMSTREVADDTHELLKESEDKGNFKDLYVVKSTPKDPKSSQYSYRISYVTKDAWIPTYIELYDKKGKLVKINEIKAINKMPGTNGRVYNVPMENVMTNVQTGHSSSIKMVNITVDQPLPDRYFTQDFLSTGK